MHPTNKLNTQPFFFVFVVGLLLYFLSSINLWNNQMTGGASTLSEERWLLYSGIFLVAISAMVWRTTRFFKMEGIHVVCVLWICLMPIFILYNKGSFGDCVYTILWPLLFEASYVCGSVGSRYVDSLKKVFIVLAIWGTFLFLQTRVNLFERDTAQSNTIYFSFLTLPWLLLVKKNKHRLFLLILFTFLVVWSLKRSAMLAVVLCWSSYMLMLLKRKRNKLLGTILILLVLSGGILGYSFSDSLLKGELSERVNREETDEGRNRLAIYTVTWAMIENSSVDNLFLGHGHFAVRKDSFLELSAHNDFLEVIYDYGLVILVLYLGLWVYVIKRCVRLFRDESPLFLPYAVSLSIFIVMSMVSHLILYCSYFLFLVLFWGCIEGSFFVNKMPERKSIRK